MHMITTILAFSAKVLSTYLAPISSYHMVRTKKKTISRSDLSKIKTRACIGVERIGVEVAIKRAMLVVEVNLRAEIAIIEFS